MAIRSYHDIGGAGAKADAYSIWIAQFIDREIRVLDHYTSQGQSLGPAMDDAGIPSWPQARQSAERQVRHLGRARLNQLPDWLVDINYGLKGGNPLPPRLQLERLVARLAAPSRK